MMKKIFIAATVILGVLITPSCNKDNPEIPISGVSIENSLALAVGQTQKLNVSIVPDNATEKVELIWSSSDPNVASIDENGSLQTLKEGEAIITVKVRNKESVAATCNLTVSAENGSIVFEDAKFEALVLYFDTNNDGKLQLSEAAVVKELVIYGNNIKSLKGIEYFTGLEKLDCCKNLLKELDVSQNLNLKYLDCSNNMIAELNVDMLEGLEYLSGHANRLTAIDVSKNLKLKHLSCGMNSGSTTDDDGITEIDVTNNSLLEYLDVYYLNLSALDVTNNPRLKHLNIGHCCHTRWDLTPIERIDLSQNPELEYFNCMSSNIRKGIGGYDLDYGMDEVDVSRNPKLTHLITYGNPKVTTLDLSNNPDLSYLSCSHNSLTVLNITNNTKLDTLSCEDNKLTALDLTKNADLKMLKCVRNQIESLDISNTKMGYLLAHDNKIASINMGIKTFDTKYPENATGNIAGTPHLYMNLNNNELTEIDLSKQTYLHWLEIKNNKLTSLDVNSCAKLHGVLCSDNLLTELKFDQLKELWELRCENNQLSGGLDISGLKNTGSPLGLSTLAAENNNLEVIYVYPSFKEDCSAYIAGVGTKPCYTKDGFTRWEIKE
ncbi:MAG: Ig-like domain-containing protein [Prevotellaceae bacterium]|jgi:hypothetical protein|nr:Ig-like domain-containing protein [Prevotellaceae bacterium]